MAKFRGLFLLTALIVAAVVVGGYLLLISPKNAAAADLTTQAAQEVKQQDTLKQQIAMLSQDEKLQPQYERELKEVAQHIPADTALPSLIREMTKAADAAHVELTNITPGIPAAATAGYAPATAAPKPTSTVSATATDSPSASASADGASGAATVAPAPAAPAGPALTTVPLSFSVIGTYTGLTDFFDRIQQFRRAFLVGGFNISIAPDTGPLDGPSAASGSATPAPVATKAYSGKLLADVTAVVFVSGNPASAGFNPGDAPTPSPSPTAVSAGIAGSPKGAAQ